LHHYVRQSVPALQAGQRDQLITCGAGGAFTHPTHAHKVVAPRTVDRTPDADALGAYRQGRVRVGRVAAGQGASRNEACFPSVQHSRALAGRNLFAFFKRGAVHAPSLWGRVVQTLNSNLGFAVVLGLLYWFNAYVNSLPFSESFAPDGFAPMRNLSLQEAAPLWLHAMVFSPFGLLMNVLMIGVCMVLGREEKGKGVLVGLLHGFAHGVLVFAGYWLMSHLVASTLGIAPGILQAFVIGLLTAAWGTLVGGLTFGLYLWIMAAWGWMPNNAYGSLAVQDYKGFMRFELNVHGTLTARFVGVERVPRHWVRHENPHHRPLWTPAPGQAPRWQIVDEFTVE
jgi:hypothetical protein